MFFDKKMEIRYEYNIYNIYYITITNKNKYQCVQQINMLLHYLKKFKIIC